METVYKETFFLSAGEANAEKEISLPLLTSKFIDIATAHANSLGIGNPSMKELNAGWVLARLSIEMDKYPMVNEEYTISTWIVSFNRHFSERAFKVTSPDGNVFGFARSIWMVMNTVDHTNLGLSHISLDSSLVLGAMPPIENQARHLIIQTEDEMTEHPVPTAIMASHPVYDYTFKYCDLDFYRHVNTVRYVTLLLNRFSLAEHDSHVIKRLELSFLHEARYGMKTQLLRSDEPDSLCSSFLLRKDSDKSPLLFARIIRTERHDR